MLALRGQDLVQLYIQTYVADEEPTHTSVDLQLLPALVDIGVLYRIRAE